MNTSLCLFRWSICHPLKFSNFYSCSIFLSPFLSFGLIILKKASIGFFPHGCKLHLLFLFLSTSAGRHGVHPKLCRVSPTCLSVSLLLYMLLLVCNFTFSGMLLFLNIFITITYVVHVHWDFPMYLLLSLPVFPSCLLDLLAGIIFFAGSASLYHFCCSPATTNLLSFCSSKEPL